MKRLNKPWYMLHTPEIGGKFDLFYKMCSKEGVLDKKTKELLMLAVASIFRSPQCIEEHLKEAFEAGATKEEIIETLLTAVAESGNTQLTFVKDIYNKYLDDEVNK